jgi:hypothetical protein
MSVAWSIAPVAIGNCNWMEPLQLGRRYHSLHRRKDFAKRSHVYWIGNLGYLRHEQRVERSAIRNNPRFGRFSFAPEIRVVLWRGRSRPRNVPIRISPGLPTCSGHRLDIHLHRASFDRELNSGSLGSLQFATLPKTAMEIPGYGKPKSRLSTLPTPLGNPCEKSHITAVTTMTVINLKRY